MRYIMSMLLVFIFALSGPAVAVLDVSEVGYAQIDWAIPPPLPLVEEPLLALLSLMPPEELVVFGTDIDLSEATAIVKVDDETDTNGAAGDFFAGAGLVEFAEPTKLLLVMGVPARSGVGVI